MIPEEIKRFRQNAGHTESLANFLNSEAGKELTVILRHMRERMTKGQGLSESRVCGRHDVFQEIDDLFFTGTQHLDQPRKPVSEKAGATPKPHRSKLPA